MTVGRTKARYMFVLANRLCPFVPGGHLGAVVGLALFGVGFVCMCIHMALERREKSEEETARATWVAEVRQAAADVRLGDYGITSVEELARYHDAAGRAAVLAARSLLVAARKIEPDAAWD